MKWSSIVDETVNTATVKKGEGEGEEEEEEDEEEEEEDDDEEEVLLKKQLNATWIRK